jgi:hypothetical protein
MGQKIDLRTNLLRRVGRQGLIGGLRQARSAALDRIDPFEPDLGEHRREIIE